jgi:hypothetical protein
MQLYLEYYARRDVFHMAESISGLHIQVLHNKAMLGKGVTINLYKS